MKTFQVVCLEGRWPRIVLLAGLSALLLLSFRGAAAAQSGWSPAPAQPPQTWDAQPPQPPTQPPQTWGAEPVPPPAAQPPQAWGPAPAQPPPYGQSAQMPAPPTPSVMLPRGVRFALEFPVINYAAIASGSGSSAFRFRLSGGAIDVGYAPSALATVGAMLEVFAGGGADVAGTVVGYVDLAPGRTRTRFFFRPQVGGTTSSGGGGWIVGARLGARVSLIDPVTIEPWLQFRYSGVSSGFGDVGVATLTIGLSVALWGETVAVDAVAEPAPQTTQPGNGWGAPPPQQQPAWQATPPSVGPPPPITAHLQSGDVALDLTAVSASEVAIVLTRNPTAIGANLDACHEARFLGDSGLITTIPLEATADSRQSARVFAGRLPSLVRAGRLTLELCGTAYPLYDGAVVLSDFLRRFSGAGGVIDESAAAPAPAAPIAPATDAPPPPPVLGGPPVGG